jgi:hypothetical protein
MRILLAIIFGITSLGCGEKIVDLSVDEIIQNSNLYHDKSVSVTGYLMATGEFEELPCIWDNEADAKKRDLAYHIRIDSVSESFNKEEWRTKYTGYAKLHGVYQYKSNDILSKFRIVDLQRVEYLDK